MSEAATPSPPPRPIHLSQSKLPPSSIFSTPSFSSTLPLARPLSASGAFRRSSLTRRSRAGSAQRRRRTRSVASTISRSSDGSLDEFSMENYTIDLAQLGQKMGGAPRIGTRQVSVHAGKEEDGRLLDPDDRRGGNSEGDSDFMDGYEINLGAFGDKPSSVVVEDQEQQRDEVDSEDDGPDDFTVNLEEWMRGTGKWQKEQDHDDVGKTPRDDGDGLENVHAGDLQDADPEESVEESVFEPLGTSTPAALRNQALVEEGVEQEAKSLAPPLSRMNTQMLQDRAAEEVFQRISALQVETERMQTEEENRRALQHILENDNAKLKQDLESSRQRHETRDRVLKDKFEELQLVHTHTKALLQQEKNQVKQDYESALERLRAFEEQPSIDHSGELEPLRRMYEEAMQESEALRNEAAMYKNATNAEIEALQCNLRASHEQSQELRTEIQSIKDAHILEINRVSAELGSRNGEVALERKESIQRANELAERDEEHSRRLTERDEDHSRKVQAFHAENRAIKNELEYAQEQLTETRRIVDTVEEENDRLVQQNDNQAQNITELKAVIKTHEAKALTPHPRVEEVDENTALELLSQQHQTKLSTLQATHAKEVQTLRSALLKASEAMQKREATLTATHVDEVALLKEEITQLRSQPPKTSNSIDTGIEVELRSAIRVLNSRLSTANASLKLARAEAIEARQKADDAVQSNEIVNAELEAHFAETVEAREKEWRRRISLLFRERDKMGKALMWGWGREEIGPKREEEREQGYRYKYVSR